MLADPMLRISHCRCSDAICSLINDGTRLCETNVSMSVYTPETLNLLFTDGH